MFYGRGMIVLIYIDDVIFFGNEQDNIDEVIKEFEDSGIYLTVEEHVYAFLRVEFITDNKSVEVTLTQWGMTKKVMNTVVMLYSNNKITPSTTIPLGTDAGGPPFGEPWEYVSVVGILMYLPSNYMPDI